MGTIAVARKEILSSLSRLSYSPYPNQRRREAGMTTGKMV